MHVHRRRTSKASAPRCELKLRSDTSGIPSKRRRNTTLRTNPGCNVVSTNAITLVPQASDTHFAFMAFAFFMAFFGASAGALAAFIAFGIAAEKLKYREVVWVRQFRIA